MSSSRTDEVGASAASTTERPPLLQGKLRLFALSFLMLFIELGLIRYSAENVVHLGYFSNLILLASFLGIGLGFLRGGRKGTADRFGRLPVTLAGYVLFLVVFPVQVWSLSPERQLSSLGPLPALPAFLEIPLLFLGATAVMAFVAEGVARSFVKFEPLEAYRLDILGSVVGILAFTALSFVGARPVFWGVVTVVLLLATLGRPRLKSLAALGLVGIFVLTLGMSLAGNDHWSPYYKVTAQERDGGLISVKVNGRPHQTMVPVDTLLETQPFYLMPYEHLSDNVELQDVLIVGAGTGNDVEVSLRQGSQRIDAVEIDPLLQRIGMQRHPDDPYGDERVTPYVNDGRAFLQNTDKRYDLILFALPDSLTLVSGQGALRLESYLFTEEAFQAAKERLKPGGVFALYNYYSPLASERFANTLQQVYGEPPCLALGEESGERVQAVLVASEDPASVECEQLWSAMSPPAPEPATDDHPFPYLEGRSIPLFYVVTLAFVIIVSLLLVRRASGGPIRSMRPFLDLFFMGAAFLLLETKNVVQFALLFGTTWLVNALVFAGVLVSVLLAIEVAKRVRLPRPAVLYGVLLVSLAAAWFVPAEWLLGLPYLPRFFAAVGIAFLPIFLANLVFAQRFKDTGSSAIAFGANLLGAMIGGVLEYGAIMVGYRSLLIVAAVLYGLAFLAGRKHLSDARAT